MRSIGKRALVTFLIATLAPLLAHADEPELFGGGTISGPASNLGPAFLPDCKSVYFGRSNGVDSVILVSEATASGWSKPTVAPFSGAWRDLEPTVSPDGKRIAFASNRPVRPGGPPLDGNWGGKAMPGAGGNLWYVERKGAGWSEPRRYPSRSTRTRQSSARASPPAARCIS